MLEELGHVLHLHVIIMRVDVGTHLDLLDLLRPLSLARGLGLFLGLIPMLADVEEFAHWRVCVRGNPDPVGADASCLFACFLGVHRSEEHTSELQSLMRISYVDLSL